MIGGDAVNNDEFITLGQLNDGSDPSTTVFVQGGNSFGTLATLGTTDNQDLRFITNNTEAMRILANGNVGIGTDSPERAFHLVGNGAIFERSGGSPQLVIRRSEYTVADWEFHASDTGNLSLRHGSTTMFRIDQDNSVLIARPLRIVDGTVAAPGIAFDNNSDTGIFRPGADTIGFSTSGNEAVRISSSGRLGVGTATPTELLHVAGNALIDNDLTVSGVASIASNLGVGGNLTVSGTGSFTGTVSGANATANDQFVTLGQINDGSDPSTTAFVQGGNSFGALATLGTTDNQDLRFITNNTEAMRVLANGNVGIGTNNPVERLQVEGPGGSDVALRLRQAGIQSWVFKNPASSTRLDIEAVSSSNTVLTLLNGGNVGIGTTSPTDKLHISGGDIRLEGTNGIRWDNGARIAGSAGSNNTLRMFDNAGNVRVRLDNSQLILNESGGNVGIGTTAPANLLHVSGGTGIVAQFSGRVIGGDAVNADEFVTLGQLEGGGTTAFVQDGNSFGSLATLGTTDANDLRFITNNTEAMRVLANGNVGIGATSPGERLEVAGSVWVNAENTFIGADASGSSRLGFVKKSGIGPVIAAGSATSLQFGNWSTGSLSGNIDTGTFAEHMRITPSGNVGIGTTAPGSLLHVQTANQAQVAQFIRGGGSGQARIQIGNADNSFWYGLDGNENFKISPNIDVATDTSFIIQRGGNVGIGTANPNSRLHVQNGASGQTISDITNLLLENNGTSNSFFALQTATAAGFGLSVTNAGNVGIGTTNPNYKLDVAGDINTTGTYRVNGTALSSSDLSDSANIALLDADNTFTGANSFTGAGTALSVTNDVTIGGTISVGTTSSFGQLTLGNDQWITGVNAAGTGGINMFKLNAQNQIQLGTSLALDGGFNFPTDGGLVTFTDMQVTDATAAGTPHGYALRLDSDNAIVVYGESDGSGGVQNLGVGIGTATPTNLLHVSGSGVVARFDGRVRGSDAVNTNEFVTLGQLEGGGTTAFVQDGNSFGSLATLGTTDANDLRFITNNAEAMRVLANGNVGIGTSAPSHLFEVNATTAQVLIQNTAGGFSGTLLNVNVPNRGDTTAYNLLNVQNTAGSALFIRGDRNIGIGTANPTGRLHVKGDFLRLEELSGGRTLDIHPAVSGSNHRFTSTTTGTGFQFENNAGELMRIQGNGNVGIGTAAPSRLLEVVGGAAGTETILGQLRSNFTDTNTATTLRFGNSTGDNVPQGSAEITALRTNTGTSGATDLIFRTSVGASMTEKLRIQAAGNVGIGTTAPNSLLDVNGQLRVRGTNKLVFTNVNSTAYLQAAATNITRLGNDEATGRLEFFTNGAERVRIDSSGNVGIGTASPSEKLTVEGNLRLQDGSQTFILNPNQNISSLNPGATSIASQIEGAINAHMVFDLRNNDTNDAIAFRYSAANDTNVDTIGFVFKDGDVGIGTTSPSERLHVSGNAIVTGNISVGTTSSFGQLTLGNDQWITGVNAAGTGGINMFKLNAQNQIQLGTSLALDGGFNFPTDGGLVTFTDMQVTSASPVGTQHGYTLGLGMENVLSVYGESDGAGGVQNLGVGIGTATPSRLLHVSGGTGIVGQFSGRVIGADAANSNEFVTKSQLDAAVGGSGIAFVQGGNSFGAAAVLGTNDSNDLVLRTDGTEHLRLSASDRHITMQANSQLRFSGNSNSLIRFQSNDNGMLLGNYATDGYTYIQSGSFNFENTYDGGVNFNINWAGRTTFKPRIDHTAAFQVQNAGGTSVFNVDTTNQRVGIGTTSPSEKLEVSGNILLSSGANRTIKVADSTGANDGYSLTLAAGSRNANGQSGGDLNLNSGAGGGDIGDRGGDINISAAHGSAQGSVNIDGGTVDIEGLSVYINSKLGNFGSYGNIVLGHNGSTQTGNVGIGAATPGAKLDIRTGSDTVIGQILRATNSTQSADLFQAQADDGTVLASINASGHFFYTNATADTNTAVCRNAAGRLAACTSLSSSKADVQDLNLGMEEIRQLRSVGFTLKATGEADYGFIAEEVAAINPLLGQYDRETGKLNGVKYTQMTALLTRGVQQLDQRLSHLEKLAGTSFEGSYLQNGDDASFAGLNVSGATTLNTLTVNGAATFNGRVVVTDSIETKDIYVNGRLVTSRLATSGETPEAELGAGLQSLADEEEDHVTVEVDGNDTAGTITVTIAADIENFDELTPAGLNGRVLKLVFSKEFEDDVIPRVTLTAANENSATATFYLDTGRTDHTQFILSSLNDLEPGKTYIINYLAVE